MSNSSRKLTLEQIQRLPKTDLHTHLDGCVRPSTLIELVKQDNVLLPGAAMPGETPPLEELRDILLPPVGSSSLVEFLRSYLYMSPALQNTRAMKRVVREMAEDYAADGVSYLEIRFCPDLHVYDGCTSEEILRAVCEESRLVTREALRQLESGIREGEAPLPVTRIIVCAIRNMAPECSVKLAELAVRLAKEEAETFSDDDRQIGGFDLAGDEAGFEMRLFKEAFDYVHQNSDLGITIHAGEAAGWESVRQAVEDGHAARIGHGVRLQENKELLQKLAENEKTTTIEICMTSNLLTSACAAIEDHPARMFYDASQGEGHAGIRISPCTDGSTVIGKTVSDQYYILQESFGFTPEELVEVLFNGYRAAFISDSLRVRLLDRARKLCKEILNPSA